MLLNVKLITVLLVLDSLWIYFFMGPRFQKMIKQITGKPIVFNIVGVAVSYIALYFLAILFLPKLTYNYEAFLFGFLVYCVFDATNYAIFDGWDSTTAALDCLWGGVLFYIIKRFVL